jgi:glutamyl-tRNA synthetase
MSDPVVRRADGSWLYMLPSVIDDIAMGVTDVLRGEDHVSNTATQVQMFAALGATPPRFAHEALLVGTEGKLSKRLGSLGVAQLREAGIEPEALVALLARLGTSDPVDPALDADALAASFDLARFGRAPARFDEAELSASTPRSSTACPSRASRICCPPAWARRRGTRSAPTWRISARRRNGGRS